MPKNKARSIGILTSGGDCQGLNAAIRAVAKSAMKTYGMDVVGILDGFRGLVENRCERLGDTDLSDILTLGGTILGTSRDKPNKMPVGGRTVDMTEQAVENYHKLHLDALVCYLVVHQHEAAAGVASQHWQERPIVGRRRHQSGGIPEKIRCHFSRSG